MPSFSFFPPPPRPPTLQKQQLEHLLLLADHLLDTRLPSSHLQLTPTPPMRTMFAPSSFFLPRCLLPKSSCKNYGSVVCNDAETEFTEKRIDSKPWNLQKKARIVHVSNPWCPFSPTAIWPSAIVRFRGRIAFGLSIVLQWNLCFASRFLYTLRCLQNQQLLSRPTPPNLIINCVCKFNECCHTPPQAYLTIYVTGVQRKHLSLGLFIY